MRKRYTEDQIIGILNESQAGAQTGALVRRHGISQQTFYRWRQKYGEMQVDEARRLRELDGESATEAARG